MCVASLASGDEDDERNNREDDEDDPEHGAPSQTLERQNSAFFCAFAPLTH